MNESLVVQLVVQAGALGICALLIINTGRKMDRLAEAVYKLVQRIEIQLDNDIRRERGE